MDDFSVQSLQESRNEWCSRLVSIFTPLVMDGVRSILNESWTMCMNNDEANKYSQWYYGPKTRFAQSITIKKKKKY